MSPRPARAINDPNRMPGQYWAYAFHTGLGSLVLVAIFVLSAQQLAWLATLANLPHASSTPPKSGAVYRGTLAGPVQTTPFGHVAVAWSGLLAVGAALAGVVLGG